MIQHADPTFLNAASTFSLVRIQDGDHVFSGRIEPMGHQWNKYWWKADFSSFTEPGVYHIAIRNPERETIESSSEHPIRIGERMLWKKTWYATALYHLQIRDSLSYVPEGGWKDCGSTLQEVSSHVIMRNTLIVP